MKITAFGDRVRVKLVDPRVDKSEGGIIIPNIAQKEPKVFEAVVLDVGMAAGLVRKGDRVLIPARCLGDRCSDETVWVKESEIFGKVEDSKILEPGLLVPG